jgi:hypothetical protein
MIHNTARIGNFTSSEIVALTSRSKDGKSFGKPALTYIQEANMERRLGRSISDEAIAKPLTWGKLIEKRVFDLLPLEYTLSSTETDVHPILPFWAGSKDGLKMDEGKTVIDIKAPFTLKSFCTLVDPLYNGLTGIDAMNALRETHKDGDKYYWQLVSNSVLSNTQFAELIVYMPYQSEIPEIKLMAQMVDAQELGKHYFIAMAGDDELPFLLDGGYYQNLNTIRFEVPLEDKIQLAAWVKEAGALLIGNENMIAVDKLIDSAITNPAENIVLTKLKK